MFNQLRLRFRTLLITSAAVFAILGISASLGLMMVVDRLNEVAKNIGISIESLRATEELETHLLIHHYEGLLSMLERADENHARRRADAGRELIRWMGEVGRHVENTGEKDLLNKVEQDLEGYLQTCRELETGQPDLEAYQQRVIPRLGAASQSTKSLIDLNFEQSQALEREARRQNRLSHLMALALVTALLTFSGAVLLGIRSWVYEPLVRLREALARYGSGDHRVRVNGKGPLELREIGEAFNQMAASLARQREVQLSFLASVAHDLRNPLSAMGLAIHLLQQGRHPSPDTANTLTLLRRQLALLERQVEDLLDTARIEAGRLDLRRVERDLREIAREAVELYGSVSDSHRLLLRMPEEGVPASIDPVRISQVLNNLISNAIKYSPDGGAIEVEVERKAAWALLSVRDQGIGISAEDRQHIFEPFRRTAATRDTIPGCGLGLSVASRIAAAHGGRIEVRSEPGLGSRFTVHLPLAAKLQEAAPGAKSLS